jgi:hypothetical protein
MGLGLDVVGAVTLAYGLLARPKNAAFDLHLASDPSPQDRESTMIWNRAISAADAMLGTVVLSLGFLLQAAATLIQTANGSSSKGSERLLLGGVVSVLLAVALTTLAIVVLRKRVADFYDAAVTDELKGLRAALAAVVGMSKPPDGPSPST